jgi:hypothetical protein
MVCLPAVHEAGLQRKHHTLSDTHPRALSGAIANSLNARLASERNMADDPKDWMKVYESVRQETDPAKQLEICQTARRAAQDRLLKLGPGGDAAEREALEDALRNIFVIEQGIKKPES